MKKRLQLRMFGEQAEDVTTYDDPNPCVEAFGYGPEGATCKTCAHLTYHQFARRYYKCRKRPSTHGPGTDHRVGWKACGKYKEAKT